MENRMMPVMTRLRGFVAVDGHAMPIVAAYMSDVWVIQLDRVGSSGPISWGSPPILR
jgi:hypothetical protein